MFITKTDIGHEVYCPYLKSPNVISVDCPNLYGIDIGDNEFICNYQFGSGKVGPTRTIKKYSVTDTFDYIEK